MSQSPCNAIDHDHDLKNHYSSFHLLGTCYVSVKLYALPYFIFIKPYEGSSINYPHFTNEKLRLREDK